MNRKPVLAYPCPWLYKIIGYNQEEMERAAATIIGGRPCTVSLSRSSRTGKYHCLNIEVEVIDEADRNAIYRAFKLHPHVKMVL
jgi:putative lipoic acid-binding regulatory protein